METQSHPGIRKVLAYPGGTLDIEIDTKKKIFFQSGEPPGSLPFGKNWPL
jgi:hypothetical protein